MPSSENDNAHVAVTTAYDQPSSCKNRFKITSIPCSGSSTAVPISEFITSSYPSNWENTDSEKYLGFSPAICPSGWNYNVIARATHSSTVATTAFCCPSGYQLRSLDQESGPASSVGPNRCERWLKTPEEVPGSAIVTGSHGDGILLIHEVWAVTWDASERATLSPKLPTLSSGETIGFWVAPQPATSQALLTRQEGNDGPFTYPFVTFLMVGLPIIFGALFTCLFCMCYWNRRKMRKERKRAEQINLDSLPPYSNIESPPAYTS
ncbi:hypothetical protein FSPOR_1353 [Fusarium sporotrichioides]|uniref:Uncharacterized protein n=1 Tax=Fusarium sporotrichioides TaxID=5514 RepID=A0A395SQM7_FUSSP|nr:hypothetical protein FSPOR_1353 [Fusarium sporotrichioides]